MAPAQLLGDDALHEAGRLGGGEQLLGGLGLDELCLGGLIVVVVGRRRCEWRGLGVGDGVLGRARRRFPHEWHGPGGGHTIVDTEGGVGDGCVRGEQAAGQGRPLLLHGGPESLLARALGKDPRPVYLVQHCLLASSEISNATKGCLEFEEKYAFLARRDVQKVAGLLATDSARRDAPETRVDYGL